MTKSESRKMLRLEIENRELRERLDHFMEVNRKMLYEIVDMKARLEMVDHALHGETE